MMNVKIERTLTGAEKIVVIANDFSSFFWFLKEMETDKWLKSNKRVFNEKNLQTIQESSQHSTLIYGPLVVVFLTS